MKKYHVEGYYEGEIEADSVEDAEMNFHESDIEDITIQGVWAVEDEYVMWDREETAASKE